MNKRQIWNFAQVGLRYAELTLVMLIVDKVASAKNMEIFCLTYRAVIL